MEVTGSRRRKTMDCAESEPTGRTTRIQQEGAVSKRFWIGPELEAKMQAGIQAALTRLNLQIGTVETPLHGNKPLEENTISSYKKHVNG
jgi:hypothetical protein